MVFADEIYDQILYDDAEHHCAAALAPDLVVPHLQRAVQDVPGGRVPLRLAGGLRPEAARHATIWRA